MTLPTVYALADLMVGCGYLAAAAAARRRARLPTLLLALTGVTWFLGNLSGLPGLLGAAAGAATYLHRGPLVHLVLTQPTGLPRSRTVAVAVATGYAVAIVPTLARSEPMSLAVAVGLLAVTALERRWSVEALPVSLLALAIGGPALARLALPVEASGAALLWYDGCLIVLAGVLANRLLRRPSAQVADLVLGLSVAPSQNLRDALARAVGDPTLQVAYVAGDGHVDALGLPVELDRSGRRVVTPLVRDAQTVGYISHDPAVLVDPLLVEAVATAAALTAANARLQADVELQAAAVRASRRRIVTAGLEERRRLEVDLRRGPGARLGRVAGALDRLPDDATEPGLLDVARRQVEDAQSDLRDLARGLHPLAVRTAGLPGAVADLGASAPVPVTVHVDVKSLPDDVAATVYYVCAEGLTNVARHARARSATVRVVQDQDSVLVTVKDDGVGGADPSGSGLRGLSDRVQALGGEVAVDTAGIGTVLRARLPVA